MSAQGVWEYAAFCLAASFSAPACRTFWTWVMIGSFAVALLLLVAVIWRLTLGWTRQRAALKAQALAEAQRDAVNYEEIHAIRWKEDAERS